MKSQVLTLTLLLIVFDEVRCQQEGCGKPLELFNCKSLVSEAGNDFCKSLSNIKKCFEEDAQCSKEFFSKIQESSEQTLGVKCGCSRLLPAAAILLSALFRLAFEPRY